MPPARRAGDSSAVLRASPAAAFWWLTVLSAAGVSTVALSDLVPTALPELETAYWVLLAFVVLGELRPVITAGRADPDGVNLGTAFVFATLLLWGPGLALLTVLVATTIGQVSRRKPLHRLLFNLAQYAWSYMAAWGVLRLAGWEATPAVATALEPVHLLPMVLAAVAYHATNLLLVGTMLGLLDQRSVWRTVIEDLGWHTVTTGAVLAMSPLVAVVVNAHWVFLPLLLIPLSLLLITAALAAERERIGQVDALTGLANRAALSDRVAALVSAHTTRGAAALCLIDLDRFKEVNDTLGHSVGDELLAAVADRLTAVCREQDTVARLGGDEFVLLFPLDAAEQGVVVAERALAALRVPFEVGGVQLEIEASAGCALIPTHGEDLETLLRRADVAMYEAKARAEVVVAFEADMEQQMPMRSALLSELRSGLTTGQFELWYQPQVGTATGALIGVEALLRWNHPTRGLLLPGQFLPLIEGSAAMREVTALVLESALTQLAIWQAQARAVPVAINASLHDVADRGFAERVIDGLARHGVRPHLLQVEITEEALVSDSTGVSATLAALQDCGISLALDDFGTGHASLTRLQRMPLDEVKIDRGFVVELDRGTRSGVAVVRAIVDLARACGLRTVAEGVETEVQRSRLQALGCDAIQGWLIARAMPAEELESYLSGSPLSTIVGDAVRRHSRRTSAAPGMAPPAPPAPPDPASTVAAQQP